MIPLQQHRESANNEQLIMASSERPSYCKLLHMAMQHTSSTAAVALQVSVDCGIASCLPRFTPVTGMYPWEQIRGLDLALFGRCSVHGDALTFM